MRSSWRRQHCSPHSHAELIRGKGPFDRSRCTFHIQAQDRIQGCRSIAITPDATSVRCLRNHVYQSRSDADHLAFLDGAGCGFTDTNISVGELGYQQGFQFGQRRREGFFLVGFYVDKPSTFEYSPATRWRCWR